MQIAGLSLWVHDRQGPPPQYQPYEDWLRATAVCEADGAQVTTGGEILMWSDLTRLLESAQAMYDRLEGSADLSTVEPYLGLSLRMEKTGRVVMTVEITPDHMTQEHRFEFDIDQSYLPPFLTQLRSVLHRT